MLTAVPVTAAELGTAPGMVAISLLRLLTRREEEIDYLEAGKIKMVDWSRMLT